MEDIVATQISEVSEVSLHGLNVKGDTDAMQISEASPAPISSFSGAIETETAIFLEMSSADIVSLWTADLDRAVAALEAYLYGSNNSCPGFHGETPAQVAQRAQDLREVEKEREKAAKEAMEEGRPVPVHPREISRQGQAYQPHHCQPCADENHPCTTNLIMRYGDGTIDPIVLTAHP